MQIWYCVKLEMLKLFLYQFVLFRNSQKLKPNMIIFTTNSKRFKQFIISFLNQGPLNFGGEGGGAFATGLFTKPLNEPE